MRFLLKVYRFRWLGTIMFIACLPLCSVEKEELFTTPALVSAKISPDGTAIAYVGADPNGILNVFISSKEDVSKREQRTFFTTPAIIQFFWSQDSKRVLLLKDEDGRTSSTYMGSTSILKTMSSTQNSLLM